MVTLISSSYTINECPFPLSG